MSVRCRVTFFLLIHPKTRFETRISFFHVLVLFAKEAILLTYFHTADVYKEAYKYDITWLDS